MLTQRTRFTIAEPHPESADCQRPTMDLGAQTLRNHVLQDLG